MNYRTGIRTQAPRECLIQFTNIESQKQAGKLIGQKVLWENGKSTHLGKIVGFHGKNGVVRARFKKGVPGQAIGSIVELIR
jgi:large subunit ribosomal protein L35Ae